VWTDEIPGKKVKEHNKRREKTELRGMEVTLQWNNHRHRQKTLREKNHYGIRYAVLLLGPSPGNDSKYLVKKKKKIGKQQNEEKRSMGGFFRLTCVRSIRGGCQGPRAGGEKSQRSKLTVGTVFPQKAFGLG